MRIGARRASHANGTRAIALAQGHGIVVLDVVCRGRRLRKRGNHQDRKGVVEWTSRTKILVSLPGLENAHIASLMAAHADVVCEIRSKASWINDLGIAPRSVLLRLRSPSGYGPDMCGAGAVAIFATNGQFGKRLAIELPVGSGHRLRSTAVAENAAGIDRPVEA